MPGKKISLSFLATAMLIAGCAVNLAQPVLPTPAAPPAASVPVLPTTRIPLTWSGLNLSGQLVFLAGTTQDNDSLMVVENLDLATGVITPLFATPALGIIYAASVSPDNRKIALSYAAPSNFPALYSMPVDGSHPPELLFTPPSAVDQYTEPAWSPDGSHIYFVHVNFGAWTVSQKFPLYEIWRVGYPGGVPSLLVKNAYWPRLSPDGSRLVYVAQDLNDGTNQLFVSAPDGSNPQEVMLNGPVIPTIIDAPLILPDGRTILFSAPPPAHATAPGWLDWLIGVQVASAHNVISEWWSVPVSGGVPAQLTHIQATSLYASISTDQHVYSFSGNGIFVMQPDGTGLTSIVSDVGGVAGTVNWIP